MLGLWWKLGIQAVATQLHTAEETRRLTGSLGPRTYWHVLRSKQGYMAGCLWVEGEIGDLSVFPS